MTRDEVKKIIAKLTILYPHFTVGETVGVLKPTDVWMEMIGDMDFDKADAAVKKCAQRCKFPPTIADIREEYDSIVSFEKKTIGEINRYYEQSRSYYPGSGEYGFGRNEFFERAKTPEQAERLYNAIRKYVDTCDSDWVMNFVECIRKIKI